MKNEKKENLLLDMFKFNFFDEENQQKIDEEKSKEKLSIEFGQIDLDELNQIENRSKNEIQEKIDSIQSDLIPAVYEGGFKTWECSHDLVDFLRSIGENSSRIVNVLEIGCGSGLPGLELNRHEHFHVDFQDFNREVLLETGEQVKKNRKIYKNRLFFGDWADLTSIIPAKHYDLLLTSETIYNTNNYDKLSHLFDHALKDDGVIFLAAKVYYFGVQGGTRQFENYLREKSQFQSRIVRVIDGNVQREILQITRTLFNKMNI